MEIISVIRIQSWEDFGRKQNQKNHSVSREHGVSSVEVRSQREFWEQGVYEMCVSQEGTSVHRELNKQERHKRESIRMCTHFYCCKVNNYKSNRFNRHGLLSHSLSEAQMRSLLVVSQSCNQDISHYMVLLETQLVNNLVLYSLTLLAEFSFWQCQNGKTSTV